VILSKKLTLNIDEEIIEFAHQYSDKTHQSISSIVESFFTELKGKSPTNELPAKTSRLYGSIKSNDLPDKKTMRKVFHEKSIN